MNQEGNVMELIPLLFIVLIVLIVCGREDHYPRRGCNTNTPPVETPMERPVGSTNPSGIVNSRPPKTRQT